MSDALRIPLYQQVFAVLHQRVSDGVYAIGDALPAEFQLADEFEVSKATIRKAVDELVRRELVERKQGSGTYVTSHGEVGAPITGSLEDVVRGTPFLPVIDVRVEADMQFPREVQQEMGVASGSVYRALRGKGGVPYVRSVHYLSEALSRVTSREALIEAGGMTGFLEGRRIPITREVQLIAARLADVAVAADLEVPVGSPVMLAVRTRHSEDGPLEVTHIWYRGDAFTFSIGSDEVLTP